MALAIQAQLAVLTMESRAQDNTFTEAPDSCQAITAPLEGLELSLHLWAVSSNFFKHARAFKVSLLHPDPLQTYSLDGVRVPSSKPMKVTKGYATRIFESARQVTALQSTCDNQSLSELGTSLWYSEWLEATAKLALCRHRELQTLLLGGFWSPEPAKVAADNFITQGPSKYMPE